MTSHTLAERIRSLTHRIDALEVIHATFYVHSVSSEERRASLGFEIIELHDLIDQLNLDYEEARERELDCAFEGAGR